MADLRIMTDLATKAASDAHEAIMRTARLGQSDFETMGIIMAAHGLIAASFQGWLETMLEKGEIPPEVKVAMDKFTSTVSRGESERLERLYAEMRGQEGVG